MAFTPGIIAFIFLAQCLAYTVKGLIGFGNPLISAPLLSMRLDNIVITPGTLLLDCPVNGYITWKNRRSFQWRRILPLLLANLCGVIPGTLLLRFSLPWIIKTALGIVVIFLGLEMATRNLRPVRAGRDFPWLRLVVAFFPACAPVCLASICSLWPISSGLPGITANSKAACVSSFWGKTCSGCVHTP